MTVTLRPPQPDDLGWIVHRHGALIAPEFGWDDRFEALAARIVADYVAHHKPGKECCFVAESDGRIAGSIFVVQESPAVAKLRLLYVEPFARGQGVGRQLLNAALGAARAMGYARVCLWTTNGLETARWLYESTGFGLVSEAPNTDFGGRNPAMGTVGQRYERAL